MNKHLLSAAITAIAAILASFSTLLLNIDWTGFQNPGEAYMGISTALMIAIRGGVKVFFETFIAGFQNKE